MNSPYINGYPKTCGYCSSDLSRCRNVYRDRTLKQDFCRLWCLERARDPHVPMIQSPWYVGLAGVLVVFMLAFTFNHGTKAMPAKLYCALAIPPSQVVSTPQLEVVYCKGVTGNECIIDFGWIVASEPVRCD